jgi:hypothetical protein
VIPEPPATGVLVLRVERQDEYVLYTIVIDVGLVSRAAPEARLATTDRDEVARVVAAFVDRFKNHRV